MAEFKRYTEETRVTTVMGVAKNVEAFQFGDMPALKFRGVTNWGKKEKETHWWDCVVEFEKADDRAFLLRNLIKGARIQVHNATLTEREHEGKVYKQLRIHRARDITFNRFSPDAKKADEGAGEETPSKPRDTETADKPDDDLPF